ncbi:MAG TPA: MerR family transcriptional regulator [bacterium]|nr:MerR family transcriptional regulator [bacterium]
MMSGNGNNDTALDEKERIYPIGIAADLLSVHPRTLRIYEDAGLLKPMRRRGRRYYTEEDLSWLECIRHLIHDDKISVEGLRRLVRLQDCWEIRGCGRRRCGRRGSGAGRGRGRPSVDVKSEDGKEE